MRRKELKNLLRNMDDWDKNAVLIRLLGSLSSLQVKQVLIPVLLLGFLSLTSVIASLAFALAVARPAGMMIVTVIGATASLYVIGKSMQMIYERN